MGGSGACMHQVFKTTKSGKKIHRFKWNNEKCRNIDQAEVVDFYKGLFEKNIKTNLPIYKVIQKIDNEKAKQIKILQNEIDELKNTIRMRNYAFKKAYKKNVKMFPLIV